jgi:hypothetical protein
MPIRSLRASWRLTAGLATPFIRGQVRSELAVIHFTGTTKSTILWSVNGHAESTPRCAKNLLLRLSSFVNQLFRRIMQPVRTSWVTGTLADLPCSRAELLADVYVLCCGSN